MKPLRRFLWWFCLPMLVLAIGCSLLLWAADPPQLAPQQVPEGQVARIGNVNAALLIGDAATCGRIGGRLTAAQTTHILRLARLSPHLRLDDATRDRLAARLDPGHRAEITAWAQAAGVDAGKLLASNLSLDTLCSVIATGCDQGAVRVGRNMDFFPAGTLGQGSLLCIRRQPGLRSFAAVTWPGYAGVVSGMNDAGVSAAVLQHYGSREQPGEPVTFRIRRVLEHAGSLAEAIALCQQGTTASWHFIVLADRGSACVLWCEDGVWKRRDPVAGNLTVSNIHPKADGSQDDERSACMRDMLRVGIPAEADLRSALGAVHLKTINAQAMLFVPERRELQLALASAFTAATGNEWQAFDLGPCLDGKGLDSLSAKSLGRAVKRIHYSDAPGP